MQKPNDDPYWEGNMKLIILKYKLDLCFGIIFSCMYTLRSFMSVFPHTVITS